ncbi:MAG TPA: hypothetical protein EYO69_05745 [Candidatus Thioglobus sp.]|jgi:hypothetical protein|nr:hypothetical protein [Candidatus Thioglobus sp.]
MDLVTGNINNSINDNGKLVSISFNDVLNYHTGNAWFGLSIAFRALELAESTFKKANLIWDRDQLTIVSAHPGPGVKDAIEYITHCISNQKFSLTKECADSNSCSSNMRFAWWISNDTHTAHISLRHNFIPVSFNELLDRIGTTDEQDNDQLDFDQLKQDLANKILQQPLLDNFHCDLYHGSIKPEQLPSDKLD